MNDANEINVDDRLRELLHETVLVAVSGPDGRGAGAVPAVRARLDQRHRRRIGARLVAAAAGVTILLIATATVIGPRSVDDRLDVGTQPSTSDTANGPGSRPDQPIVVTDVHGVDALARSPLAGRAAPAMVWSGERLVVWGGTYGSDNYLHDGAVYDAATKTWTAMPAGPLDTADGTIPHGVMTGAGVLIGLGHKVALFDPRAGTWRALPDAPAAVRDLVSDGRVALSVSANAVLDPVTTGWQALPAFPAGVSPYFAVATDQGFVVVANAVPATRSFLIDPDTRTLEPLPDLPTSFRTIAMAADWDGRRVVLVNYLMDAITFDPATRRWSVLPPMPVRGGECGPGIGSAGGLTLVDICNTALVLDTHDKWIPLPTIVVAGYTMVNTSANSDPRSASTLLVWTDRGDGNTGTDLSAIDLGRAIANPPEIQAGIGKITMPPGMRVTDARFESNGKLPIHDAVIVEIGNGRGATCTVSSIYLGFVTGNADSANEMLDHDGATTRWHVRDGGTVWELARESFSDSFEIACSDADLARTVAAATSFGPGA
jgi:hypothetical protein